MEKEKYEGGLKKNHPTSRGQSLLKKGGKRKRCKREKHVLIYVALCGTLLLRITCHAVVDVKHFGKINRKYEICN